MDKKIEEALVEIVDEEAFAMIKKIVDEDIARWVWDSEYRGVAGLIRNEDEAALGVLYIEEHDFESSVQFDRMLEEA